jgi:translation initiation factor IF-1
VRERDETQHVAKKDAIEVEGTVLEPLPNTMFSV